MLRKATDQLVIKPRLSSTTRLLVALAAVVIIAGVSLAGYLGGRGAVRMQLESRAQEIMQLRETLRQSLEQRALLEAELDSTREQLAQMRTKLEATRSSLTKVTRQLQIDQSAYQELREQLEESNKQITRLGNELKFYRSIISPSDGESGVKVQAFRLKPTDTSREYRYRLTLIQALDHDDTVSGMVRFEVEGTQEGREQTVQLPANGEDPIAAEFKYFQNLVGTIMLPNGFVPTGIRVIFKTRAGASIDRDYPWPPAEGDPSA